MQLNPMPFNIKLFTHNAESKMLVSDMSDLGCRAGDVPFKQLYDDAADEGIGVYNPRAGSGIRIASVLVTLFHCGVLCSRHCHDLVSLKNTRQVAQVWNCVITSLRVNTKMKAHDHTAPHRQVYAKAEFT